MVMTAGLSNAELAIAVAAFARPHRMRRQIAVCTLDHAFVQDIGSTFQDGQVNIDASGETTRAASLTLFDPTHQVGLDTADATHGSVSPKYLLRLHRGLFVDELDRWVDFPAGMLWPKAPSRAGDILSVNAYGKEKLAQRPVWTTLVLKKGTNKISAIQTAMSQLCGERFFRLTSTTETLGADISIGRDTTVWAVVKQIAESMGWRLFYDAEGYLVCRPPSTDPAYLFRTGVGGTVRDDIGVGYDENLANLVFGTGGTPSGKKAPIEAFAVAPPGHALSPAELARGGVDGVFRSDLSSDETTKQADLQRLVDQDLERVLMQSIDLGFDSFPVWHLEEGDPIAAQQDGGAIVPGFFTTASLPLAPGYQSNGYMRQVGRRVRPLGGISALGGMR